jgi:hypothetical protein
MVPVEPIPRGGQAPAHAIAGSAGDTDQQQDSGLIKGFDPIRRPDQMDPEAEIDQRLDAAGAS